MPQSKTFVENTVPNWGASVPSLHNGEHVSFTWEEFVNADGMTPMTGLHTPQWQLCTRTRHHYGIASKMWEK
eukprot:3797545-Amphidinium_carterae.1